MTAIWLTCVVWPSWILLNSDHVLPLPATTIGYRYDQGLKGLGAVAIGLFLFQMAYNLVVTKQRQMIRRPTDYQISRGRLIGVLVCCGVVSSWALFGLTSRQGGLWSFIFSIDEFRNHSLTGAGLYFLGMSVMNIGFYITCLAAVQGNVSVRWAFAMLIAAVGIGLAGAYRHLAIEALTAWPTLRARVVPRVRSPRANWRIIAIAVAIILLNVLYVAFRAGRGDIGRIVSGRPCADLVFDNFLARFHGVESLARIVDYTKVNGYDGGGVLIESLLTAWIPRAAWPDKPVSAGAVANVRFFGEIFHSTDETGAAIPSLAGELYWVAGPGGVAFGFLVLGWCCGLADRMGTVRRDFISLGTYILLFNFFLFVNESLSLHLVRLVENVIMWYLVAGICKGTVFCRKSAPAISLKEHTQRQTYLYYENLRP